MNPDDYNYETSGFNGFLSRSIDTMPQVNLDSPGIQSTQIRYDSSQVSGMLGDSLKVGSVVIDGVSGRISIYDGDVEVVRIGELDG